MDHRRKIPSDVSPRRLRSHCCGDHSVFVQTAGSGSFWVTRFIKERSKSLRARRPSPSVIRRRIDVVFCQGRDDPERRHILTVEPPRQTNLEHRNRRGIKGRPRHKTAEDQQVESTFEPSGDRRRFDPQASPVSERTKHQDQHICALARTAHRSVAEQIRYRLQAEKPECPAAAAVGEDRSTRLEKTRNNLPFRSADTATNFFKIAPSRPV